MSWRALIVRFGIQSHWSHCRHRLAKLTTALPVDSTFGHESRTSRPTSTQQNVLKCRFHDSCRGNRQVASSTLWWHMQLLAKSAVKIQSILHSNPESKPVYKYESYHTWDRLEPCWEGTRTKWKKKQTYPKLENLKAFLVKFCSFGFSQSFSFSSLLKYVNNVTIFIW